ncbi:probable ribosome biogenesis protein RLP24 [Eurytemora carolleeae]|uniref:probable ribosome biogenesis protein RLP24 n=1 Tax=Eurytemora carolleeae TaxID=1294199 RepID=UPI000C75C9C7|nr:probable ribosome biogenesis protein RLP24 [Eurytemora carolleeae]|eukprot:XP_023323328.1 probable ribosome biogenesis protein RLP24 [Eurytemora affinis]
MRIERCYFCGSSVYPGKGTTFVRNDCKIFRFCRSKCHRAFKKKKNPRKAKWTKAFRKSAGKELAVDPSFEFEKRRNIPVKYDRELWNNTITAMQRVEVIKNKRQSHFIFQRMKLAKKIQKAKDIKEVERDLALIKSPAAGLKRANKELEEEDMELAGEIDSSINLVPQKVRAREEAKIEEIHESDEEMAAN